MMAFLAQAQILECINRGELIKQNSDPRCAKQSSYDLRLGREIYIVGSPAPRILDDDDPYLSLPPGQFAILTCLEEIDIPPAMMAFISVRSKYKFEGLVNISGFHVDPSFRGVLRFGVQNVGPTDIHLKFREPTFTIFFAELTSKDIGETRDDQDEVHFKQNLTGIRLEDVQLLGGSSLTLSTLQRDVDRLRTLVTIYGAAAISALFAIILRLIFH
jgi:dCTP deaminase